MSKLVEVGDLSFSYGTTSVFSHVNLTVSEAEVICLMGPNGCGKTTLMDSIMALKKTEKRYDPIVRQASK